MSCCLQTTLAGLYRSVQLYWLVVLLSLLLLMPSLLNQAACIDIDMLCMALQARTRDLQLSMCIDEDILQLARRHSF